MAITGVVIEGKGYQSVASGTTEAFTPSVNKLGLFSIQSALSGTRNTPTITSTTTGLTLVQVGESKNTGYGITVFRAMKSSGLSNGTISFSFAGQTQDNIITIYSEFDGIDTSGTDGSGAIVQTATNFNNGDVGTVSATLAAFANANNGTYFGAAWQQVTGSFTTFTPNAGFSELDDGIIVNGSAVMGRHLCWRADNSTTCTSTSDSGTGHVAILGLEIAAAAAPPPPTDTFTAAWSSQGTILLPGRPRMVPSGPYPGPRIP